MTEGVKDVATEGAIEGAIDCAEKDSALSVLSRVRDRPISVVSESASVSSVLAMEAS